MTYDLDEVFPHSGHVNNNLYLCVSDKLEWKLIHAPNELFLKDVLSREQNIWYVVKDLEETSGENCDTPKSYCDKKILHNEKIIEAQENLISAMSELLDARSNEYLAAVAHDDYLTGGKIQTGRELKTAQTRVLMACDKVAEARSRLSNIKGI